MPLRYTNNIFGAVDLLFLLGELEWEPESWGPSYRNVAE